jgi:predicted nuclease of predicted toxin-antitoxin system
VIRFHLDENVNHRIADGLRRRGVDVTTSTDAGLLSADDREQLDFATRVGRVLFTHDPDLLAEQRGLASHAGIVFSRKDRRSIGDIVRYLALMCEVVTEEEMRDRVEYY